MESYTSVQGINFLPESDHVPDILLQEYSTWLSRIPPVRRSATITIRTWDMVYVRPNVFRCPHEHLLEVKRLHGWRPWNMIYKYIVH